MKNFLRKTGFTMVELMVVIAIIATIMGVLMGGMFGATESANQAKCLVHMQNLYKAVTAVAMNSGYYPAAQSYEYMDYDSDGGERYMQHQGWVGWDSKDAYYPKGYATSSKASSGWRTTFAAKELDTYVAITNGAIWKASSGSIESYTCPTHLQETRGKSYKPGWSYVMNSIFKYDITGNNSFPGDRYTKLFNSIAAPARTLMFAELPFIDHEKQRAVVASASPGNAACDSVLQYDDGMWGGTKECIGFNHKISEREVVGHVCFADGHTEKLPYPAQDSNLVDLTRWLCDGVDISFSKERYKNSSDDD